jgi:phage terminase large subunit-like protein
MLLDRWDFWARDSQLPPDGDWRIWLFLGGRGAGKTRAGAVWIAARVRDGRARRIGLIGDTDRDARQVMVEGESGLLAVVEGLDYQPSNNLLRWPDGAEARLLSAAEPDSFRGYQFDCLWGDEFAKWRAPQDALDMALKALLAQDRVAVTRSFTQENEANLADGFVAYLEARYGGTRLGRQELDSELIEDNDHALWRRDWIERARVQDAPALARIVVALDPPASSHGDECGLVIAGRDAQGEGYVLADRSAGGLSPAAWAARAAQAFADFEADAIVAEANQGGEMVRRRPAPICRSGWCMRRAASWSGRNRRRRCMSAAASIMSARCRSWRIRCVSMTARKTVPTAWMRWSGRWPICSRARRANRAYEVFKAVEAVMSILYLAMAGFRAGHPTFVQAAQSWMGGSGPPMVRKMRF